MVEVRWASRAPIQFVILGDTAGEDAEERCRLLLRRLRLRDVVGPRNGRRMRHLGEEAVTLPMAAFQRLRNAVKRMNE